MPKPPEQGTCELELMQFKAKDGQVYTICQRMSVSFVTYRRGKVVLGHPDLKMMLAQIRDGKVDSQEG